MKRRAFFDVDLMDLLVAAAVFGIIATVALPNFVDLDSPALSQAAPAAPDARGPEKAAP